MILVTCTECQSNHLVGYRRLVEVRNTDNGPIALAMCPNGHLAHANTAATASA